MHPLLLSRIAALLARCGLLLQTELRGLSVTTVSPAKTAEPIEMLLELGFGWPKEPCTKGKEGKEEYLYSAILVRTHTLKALRHGSQFYVQTTPCLPFLRKRSPDGATPKGGSRHRIAAYYSFIDPEGMKG